MFDVRRLEDIDINDVGLKTQYYNFFINGDIDSAKNLINENPNLKFKVLNAENLNKIIENILILENNYYTNVEDVLGNHLSKYQMDINDLIYLRNYNEETQYNINNFVLYNEEIYYCKDTPPIGTEPTNTNYWIYLGLKGYDSYPSLGVKYQGNWSSSKNYNKYDLVIYQNKLYVAKLDNINKTPDTSLEEWSLQMEVENQGIFVSETEPLNLKDGSIWVQILK